MADRTTGGEVMTCGSCGGSTAEMNGGEHCSSQCAWLARTEYPDGLTVVWLDDETRRLFEQVPDMVVNGSRPDTSQSYFLDLIGRIDAVTDDRSSR